MNAVLTEQDFLELDSWVAEHVMGWIVKSRQCPHSGSVTEHFWFEPGDEIEFKFRSSTQRMFPSGTTVGNRYPKEMPRYSSDSAAAMEVLRKCGQKEIRGTAFVCISFSDGNTSTLSKNGHWTVGRLDRNSHWVSGEMESALTLELAICLFSRKLYS